MKKTKKVLLNLILGILVFCISSNVYAVDRCIYEGEWGTLTITNSLDVINELVKNYKPNYPEITYKSKDNLYAFIDHTNTSGKKQVYFKNVQYSMSAQITATSYYNNFDKRAFKTDEWKNVFDQNTDALNCIDLYYKTEFDDKIGKVNDTNIYRFSPTSDNGEYSLKVSPSNVLRNDENKETTKACTSTDVDNFIKYDINTDMMEQYEAEISGIINDLHLNDEYWDEEVNKLLISYTKKPEVNPNYSTPNTDTMLEIKLTSPTMSEIARIHDLIKNNSYNCAFSDADVTKIINAYNNAIQQRINDLTSRALNKIQKAYDEGKITKEENDSLQENWNNAMNDYQKEVVGPALDWLHTWYQDYAGVLADCRGILDSELVDIINEILNWIRIIVPIVVIVLSTVDFGKAVLNQEKDELKQAFIRFVKRLIIAVIIFFVPTLIHIIVNAVNSFTDIQLTDLPDCGIK